jgi:hypothetical protein
LYTFTYGLFNDANAAQIIQYQRTGQLMNNEFARIWKEAVVASCDTPPQSVSAGSEVKPRNTSVSTASL